MATSKVREKRRLARARKIEKEKVELQDQLEEVDPIDLSEEEGLERIEKMYDGPEEEGHEMPTSFDELDAMWEAEDKARKARDLAWKTGDLVHNIVHSDMDAEEKGKKIAQVGNEFPKRLKSVIGETVEKESHDMDLLELEAFIARDQRSMGGYERVINWFSQKAKLTAAAEAKLSDDDFALVVMRDGKKMRKYPIHDKAHVRNALARAAQMMKEGGEAATDARAALPKIRAAAKRMGIGAMEKSANSVIVEKDLSGNWRAVLIPSNNFMDTDGEILSEAAHLEYVDWVSKNMHLAPVFTTWHMPELVRKNAVDFVDYANGFLIMSAPLEEHEAAQLLKTQASCVIGMSHGTLVLERDPHDDKIITKYRMVEVSDLPLDRAANPFTDFALISKEADMNKLDYLSSLLGPEKAKEILEKSELKQKDLREQGVQEKEAKAPETVAEKTSESVPPAALDIDAILKAVDEHLDVPGLSAVIEQMKDAVEKVPVLELALKEMQKSTDDALAEKIAPRITGKLSWTMAASNSDKNIVNKDKEEDKKLSESKPEVHWLAEIAGVEPVAQEA